MALQLSRPTADDVQVPIGYVLSTPSSHLENREALDGYRHVVESWSQATKLSLDVCGSEAGTYKENEASTELESALNNVQAKFSVAFPMEEDEGSNFKVKLRKQTSKLSVQLTALRSIVDVWGNQRKTPIVIYREMMQYSVEGHLTANILSVMGTEINQFQSTEEIQARCKQFQKEATDLLQRLDGLTPDSALICQIQSVLAVGTTSTLLNAIHKENRQRIVVKAIDKARYNAYCKRYGSSLQVRTELDMLKKCKHKLIPDIHGVVDTVTTFYILMEHCGERNLLDYIFKVGPLIQSNCVILARDIFTALDYLSRLKIVHRDVKPQNLTLYTHTNTLHLKLIDFGLAKVSPCSTYIGTRGYMAPELYLLHERLNYGIAVDAWAGGVTVYEMITAEPPFNIDAIREETLAGILDFANPIYANNSAKHLVASLLKVDVDARATSSEVLGHPWFQSSPLI